jgi:hypothetical protein
VRSYVGAIGMGWLLAQCVSHFVNIFAAPVAIFISRRDFGGLAEHPVNEGFSLQSAFPELIRFSLLLVIFYLLLRWLYYTPIEDATDPAA